MSCHLPKPDLLPTRYIRCVQELGLRELVKKKARFYLWAGLAALALLMFFVIWFSGVGVSTYANISENRCSTASTRHQLGAIMPTLALAGILLSGGNFRPSESKISCCSVGAALFDLHMLSIADIAWRIVG
jgi:H+/Cl- antiporter ClcA